MFDQIHAKIIHSTNSDIPKFSKMSDGIVDDPMDINQAEPVVEQISEIVEVELSSEPQQLEMGMLEQRVTPAPEAFIQEQPKKEDQCEVYDLQVSTAAVDIEVVQCTYTSLALQFRLEFLIDHCPPIRREAIFALINHIRENTQNISRYTLLFKELETEEQSKSNAQPKFDAKWLDETALTLAGRFDGLQGEYKRQKDEGVKESTRRAMEDLFHHYVKAGQFDEALRLYSRGIRDHCTQLKHSINMWVSWIEVSIAASEFSKIDGMAQQAIRTIREAEKAEIANTSASQRNENAMFMIERDVIVQANNTINNRILIDTALAKVLAVQAIVKIGQRSFKDAAEKILEINMDNLEPKWFVTPADLGVYALLCCLSTYSRSELKKVIETGTFRRLLESEPKFFEVLNCYVSSNFGKCFEILTNVQPRLLLDPFISKQIADLYSRIRQNCVVQYLKPYSSIRFETMAEALGYTVKEIETVVIGLIESGDINVKIDQLNGVLRMVGQNDDKSTQRRVLEVCDETLYRTHVVHWKSMLSQANIVFSAEKEQRGTSKRRTKFADSGSKEDSQGNIFKRVSNANEELNRTADEADFSPTGEAENLIVEEPNAA